MALVNISIADGGPGELYSLFGWLQRDDEFRGKIKTSSPPNARHDMGSVVEVLSIMLGSGGAGVVLAGSLAAWLQTRRARVCVEILREESGEFVRRVEVDAGSPAVTGRLLRNILVGGEELR